MWIIRVNATAGTVLVCSMSVVLVEQIQHFTGLERCILFRFLFAVSVARSAWILIDNDLCGELFMIFALLDIYNFESDLFALSLRPFDNPTLVV
jgi:hypothetical protein